MANFVRRQIARESVEGTGTVVPDGLELPHESVEGILADLKEKENETDRDLSEASVLEEDSQETEGQMAVLDEAQAAADGSGDDDGMEVEDDMSEEEVEAIDVAQESIRKRWDLDRQSVARESFGSRSRRTVARESMWEDFKGLIKRFWEWLKEQGRKIKDRWITFTNAGKTLQKRAKKYAEQIKKLGKLKDGKDTVSGSFVAKLSIGGKFMGNDLATLKSQTGDNLPEAYDSMIAEANGSAEMLAAVVTSGAAANTDEEKIAKGIAEAEALMKRAVSKENMIGNLVVDLSVSDDGDMSVTVTDYDGSTEDEVKTPTVSQLSSSAKFLEDLGKGIEKTAKAYHANNQRREKLEKTIEKVLNAIDKLKVDELPANARDFIGKCRRATASTVKLASELERINARLIRSVSDGMSGYVAAGIACYEVRKN
ncbi:MAG: hypothetical protein ACRDBQ_18655 [Shewanella sp.]